MKRIRLFVVYSLIVGCFVFPSFAAVQYDPAYTWRTIETAHFSIHYHDGLEKLAEEFAPQAEEVHRKLAPFLRHTPEMKTNVVLVDNVDYGNGWATVIPGPLVSLYVTNTGSNLSPYSYKNWLKYVFFHEYTHVLNMDTIGPASKLTKMIFGRVIFPNSIAPGFMLEGLAVYMESHFYDGGRIFNPRFEALLRMDILEDNMKSIDQAAINTVRWPGKNLWYVYGSYFFEYLSETYGQHKITDLNLRYGDYILYSGIDQAFRAIYGKSLIRLWDDWIIYEKEKYNLQKQALQDDHFIKPDKLTSSGHYNLQPIWSEDSENIYYAERDYSNYPAIKKYNLNLRKSEKVAEQPLFEDNLDLLGQKLIYSKGTVQNNFYFHKDIYVLDIKNKKKKRITEGRRAADPAFSPDGKLIVFTELIQGSRYLRIIENGKIAPIGDNVPGVSYFHPVFSPNGRSIVAAKWVEGDQSLYQIDLESGREEKLIDFGLCGNPSFSADGDYILFDSDKTGVANIFALRLEDRQLFQVTGVLGMALMPAVSPDGEKITFVNYSSNGYDLALIPFDPSRWREVELQRSKVKDKKPKINENKYSVRKTDYNPLPALIPKLWLPLSVIDENGRHTAIYTQGIDSLQQHYYQAQLSYDWAADRPIYQIAYLNNQLLPQISVQITDFPLAYSWDGGTRVYWERYSSQQLLFSFVDQVVFEDYDGQSISVGLENIQLTSISTLSTLSTQPSLGSFRGLLFKYRYSNARSYAKSISPEEGIDCSLTAGIYLKGLSSSYNLNRYKLHSNFYHKLPNNNVLALLHSTYANQGDIIIQQGYWWNTQPVRGYISDSFAGNKGSLVSLEYRFPISYPEKGLGYGYTFFDKLHGALFLEAGGATFNQINTISFSKSYGAEITLGTINGFNFAPADFTLGFAEGLDAGGEKKVYFSYSTPGFNLTIGQDGTARPVSNSLVSRKAFFPAKTFK
ncbi:hypothetical protein ACFL52_03615 [Candidatus Margulisiibacteriota bacterium]